LLDTIENIKFRGNGWRLAVHQDWLPLNDKLHGIYVELIHRAEESRTPDPISTRQQKVRYQIHTQGHTDILKQRLKEWKAGNKSSLLCKTVKQLNAIPLISSL
jgi:hypothetical protein